MRAAVAAIALAQLAQSTVPGLRIFRLHPGGLYNGPPDDIFQGFFPDAFELEALAAAGTDASLARLEHLLGSVAARWPKAVPSSLEPPRWRNGVKLSAESFACYLVHLLGRETYPPRASNRGKRSCAGAAALIERALDPESLVPLAAWLVATKLPRSLRRQMPSGSRAVADFVGEAVRAKRLSRSAYKVLSFSTANYDRLYAPRAFEQRWLWWSVLSGQTKVWIEGRWPTEDDAIAGAEEWRDRAARYLEEAMRLTRKWTLAEFRPLLAHPVTRAQIPGLVFVSATPALPNSSVPTFLFDTTGRPDPEPKGEFRVGHPAERSSEWPTPQQGYPFADEASPVPDAKPDLEVIEPIPRRVFIKRCREFGLIWFPCTNYSFDDASGYYSGPSFSISFVVGEPTRSKVAFKRIDFIPPGAWKSPLVRAETWRLVQALAGASVPEVTPLAEVTLPVGMTTGRLGRCERCRGVVRRTDVARVKGDKIWHERCAPLETVTGRLGCCKRCGGVIHQAETARAHGDTLWHGRCAPKKLKR